MKVHQLKPQKYFTNFEQYQTLLLDVTKRVCSNAQSPKRKLKYEPISTISSGYDSCATSAIATKLGYLEGVTIDVNVWNLDDSGENIGKQLGMNVKSVKHLIDDKIENLNLEFTGELEEKSLEFIATLGIGDDITFVSLEKYLANRLFLSGVYGDIVWEKNNILYSGLIKPGLFGKSITEFRLRVGYFHFPVPAIGARFSPSILKLTNSKEMAPYVLNNNYDRPLPRRILEDSGVDRQSFGVTKCATAPNILNRRELFPKAIKEIRKRYKSFSS